MNWPSKNKSQNVVFQILLSALEEQKPELTLVKENLNTLMESVDERTPHSIELRDKVSEVNEKHEGLICALKTHKNNLEEDVAHASVFQKSLQDLEPWLLETTAFVSTQQPISTDPENVRKQLEEAQVWKCISCSLLTNKRERYINQ